MAVTITSLKNNYADYLQALNPEINASSPYSYWQIQGGAMASMFLDLYYNLQLVQNSIYIQNAVGSQVDLILYERGLPARGGLTYGTIQAVVNSATPITIPANTIFTDVLTANEYQTLQEFIVLNNTTQITLYAINSGSGYIESTSSSLTSNSITLGVVSSTNGQEEESDQSCITRALQSVRSPISGARQTDYSVYALEANNVLPLPIITDSIIIPSFVSINNVGILGVFPLIGTSITEYQLNQGLISLTNFIAYTRAADSNTIVSVNNYIQAQRLVGLSVITGTSITHKISSTIVPIPVSVSLASGYSLSSLIAIESQDNSDSPITINLTVEQLIKREIRRAICDQQFGATKIGTQNYITIESLISALNTQLSATNGQLSQLLTNIVFGITDIGVPNYSFNATNLFYTYDITAYSDIQITLVS